jgi:hypothetical protein
VSSSEHGVSPQTITGDVIITVLPPSISSDNAQIIEAKLNASVPGTKKYHITIKDHTKAGPGNKPQFRHGVARNGSAALQANSEPKADEEFLRLWNNSSALPHSDTPGSTRGTGRFVILKAAHNPDEEDAWGFVGIYSEDTGVAAEVTTEYLDEIIDEPAGGDPDKALRFPDSDEMAEWRSFISSSSSTRNRAKEPMFGLRKEALEIARIIRDSIRSNVSGALQPYQLVIRRFVNVGSVNYTDRIAPVIYELDYGVERHKPRFHKRNAEKHSLQEFRRVIIRGGDSAANASTRHWKRVVRYTPTRAGQSYVYAIALYVEPKPGTNHDQLMNEYGDAGISSNVNTPGGSGRPFTHA